MSPLDSKQKANMIDLTNPNLPIYRVFTLDRLFDTVVRDYPVHNRSSDTA